MIFVIKSHRSERLEIRGQNRSVQIFQLFLVVFGYSILDRPFHFEFLSKLHGFWPLILSLSAHRDFKYGINYCKTLQTFQQVPL